MSLRGRPGTLRDSHARSVRGEGGSRWFASMVGVAQLVRAPGCGPGGRGFETHLPPQRMEALQQCGAFSLLNTSRLLCAMR